MSSAMVEAGRAAAGPAVISPVKLAHIVLRTSRFGPTTSRYYADPDHNQIELQVEKFDTIAESTAFFYSAEFAENPIGVEFDAYHVPCGYRGSR